MWQALTAIVVSGRTSQWGRLCTGSVIAIVIRTTAKSAFLLRSDEPALRTPTPEFLNWETHIQEVRKYLRIYFEYFVNF